MTDKKTPTLAEIKAQLAARGLKLVDYKHLTYSQLRKLAGL